MAAQIGVFDVIKMIFVLVVILFCTYYATKFLAARAAGVNSSKGFFNIGNDIGEDKALPRVIHRIMVNKDSSLVLIEYNGCEYLVAFAGTGVQMIEKRELSKEEISLRAADMQKKEQNSFQFSKHMDKYMEKFKESQSNKGVDKIEKED